jgi:hypothetical protein
LSDKHDFDFEAFIAEAEARRGPPKDDPRAPPQYASTDRIKLSAQITRCLRTLVGSSGNLAGYSLCELRVTGSRELPEGLIEWSFEADAIYESEFTVYDEEHGPAVHTIQGSIVLDADYRLQIDGDGRVRLAPWTTTASLLGIR